MNILSNGNPVQISLQINTSYMLQT